MNDSSDFSDFGFIGFGLIGGSIAHALREIFPSSRITAYNYHVTKKHPKLEAALADGILTDICTDLSDMGKLDVIFLCAPVMTNVEYLKRLKPHLSGNCLLTDVGSVKGNIHHEIENLGLGHMFVGGHPMTGSEKTGYENSTSSYLKGAYYILTPTQSVPKNFTDWLADFVKAAGSHCAVLDYKQHDRITAAISHAPHIISASLINTVASMDKTGEYARLAAGGLKDITRISSSSPEMWQNICLTNPDCIVSFLDKFIKNLEEMKRSVMEADGGKLTEYFKRAKDYRDSL